MAALSEDLFYHGTEADLFTFYQVPKILFTDPLYKPLSVDAKMLYSAMRDRMSLSIKNEWIDDNKRVFVKFSVKAVEELLNCAKQKVTKIYRELEDVQLIYRKRQGLGEADLIYVLKPVLSQDISDEYKKNAESIEGEEREERDENRPSSRMKIIPQEGRKTSFRQIENQTFEKTKNEPTEVQKSSANNIISNQTDSKDTDSSKTDSNETSEMEMDVSNDLYLSHINPPTSLPPSLSSLIDQVMSGQKEASSCQNDFIREIKDHIGYDAAVDFSRRMNERLKERMENGLISVKVYETGYTDLNDYENMLKEIVRVFEKNGNTPVYIEGSKMDRATVLKHLCNHRAFQFVLAWKTAKEKALSGNIGGFAITTLYNLPELGETEG